MLELLLGRILCAAADLATPVKAQNRLKIGLNHRIAKGAE
jgi:predicted secreted protein